MKSMKSETLNLYNNNKKENFFLPGSMPLMMFIIDKNKQAVYKHQKKLKAFTESVLSNYKSIKECIHFNIPTKTQD